MTVPRSAAGSIEAARTMLGLSRMQLWFDYIALGGDVVPDTMLAFLTGDADIPAHQYDIVIQALNERFLDRGDNHPLPYADELPEPT